MRPLDPVSQTGEQTLAEGAWLALQRLTFRDNANIERSWERCIRKSSSSALDGKVPSIDRSPIRAVYAHPLCATHLIPVHQ